ncbi:MAG: hypothetical protein WD066_01210 [Planctomycetaceae bacterium]
MPGIEKLVPTLASLPRREYSDLIRQVDEQRRKAAEFDSADDWPSNAASRDEFAVWIARRHFAIDKGIVRILHLPTGAPVDEVRLLEVNALAQLPEDAPVEAVDFMPDIEGVSYSLYVADVTPRQLEEILGGRLALPDGWQLAGHQELSAAER